MLYVKNDECVMDGTSCSYGVPKLSINWFYCRFKFWVLRKISRYAAGFLLNPTIIGD